MFAFFLFKLTTWNLLMVITVTVKNPMANTSIANILVYQ